MIVGITGKSGSGKSTIANLISELDKRIIVVEIDKIGHEVITCPIVIENIVKAFGPSVIDNDGHINRKKVAELVFNNRDRMKQLSQITWRYMEETIDNIIKNNEIVILDWILLPKVKYFGMCDIKILINVPYEKRKEKAMIRDQITIEKFDEREKASIEYDESQFDYVINNAYVIEDSKEKVGEIYVKSIISR